MAAKAVMATASDTLMERRHVITYTDSMGVKTEATFETMIVAIVTAKDLTDGEYIGMRVWPSETTLKN